MLQISGAIILAAFIHTALGVFGIIGRLIKFVGPLAIGTMLLAIVVDLLPPITRSASTSWIVSIRCIRVNNMYTHILIYIYIYTYIYIHTYIYIYILLYLVPLQLELYLHYFWIKYKFHFHPTTRRRVVIVHQATQYSNYIL